MKVSFHGFGTTASLTVTDDRTTEEHNQTLCVIKNFKGVPLSASNLAKKNKESNKRIEDSHPADLLQSMKWNIIHVFLIYL